MGAKIHSGINPKDNTIFAKKAQLWMGVLHLVRSHKTFENLTLHTPDMQTYVCVSGGKNVSFSEHFAYVLNE